MVLNGPGDPRSHEGQARLQMHRTAIDQGRGEPRPQAPRSGATKVAVTVAPYVGNAHEAARPAPAEAGASWFSGFVSCRDVGAASGWGYLSDRSPPGARCSLPSSSSARSSGAASAGVRARSRKSWSSASGLGPSRSRILR